MKSFIRNIVIAILNVEARIVIKKYKPTIITVTGSVGKTSTKDAIFTVLSAGTFSDTPQDISSGVETIRKSQKSLNSEIGVPLTILGCSNAWYSLAGWMKNIVKGLDLVFFKSNYPSCLVLEIGADHPGDIKRLTKWLKPDIAVITKIGEVPVHVEFFPSRDKLVEEKLSMARAVKDGGTVILLANDADTAPLHKELALRNIKVLTYAVDMPADFSASHIEVSYADNRVPVGIAFHINHSGNSIPVKLHGVLGSQHVYPVLIALAVGVVRGKSLLSVIGAFEGHLPPPGRMNLLKGIKESTIIDDTYNSSPDAVLEALYVLRSLITPEHGRKMIVLGDMMELGKFSSEEHKKAGVRIAELFSLNTNYVLVTVGQRARLIRDGALAGGMMKEMVHWYGSSSEAAPEVLKLVEGGAGGDVVLVKGSQSSRMERVSFALLAEPARAEEFLVRQEVAWLAKK